MAIRRAPQNNVQKPHGGIRSNGPRPLDRAELQQLQQEFAALSGEDRAAADAWIAKLRPSLAKVLLG